MTDVATLHRDIVSSFFDENYYVARYPDVKGSGVNPLSHFLKNGVTEDRSPCAWIDTRYCKFISKRAGKTVETLGDFVNFYLNLDSNSLLGTSPYFCPTWLAKQFGVKAKKLSELVDIPVDHSKPVSWHPLVLFELPPYDISCFRDWVLNAPQTKLFNTSLLDVKLYIQHHKDLHQFRENPGDAFSHFLRRGIFENRLKPMGVGVPTNDQNDVAFIKAMLGLLLVSSYKADLRHLYQKHHLDGPITIREVEEFDFLYLKEKLGEINQRVRNPQPGQSESIDSVMDFLLEANRGLSEKSTLYTKKRYFNSKKNKSILDLDLFNVRHKVETKRVLYSVNIGNYDLFPEIVPMDDCSYFLITDSVDEPDDDIPWVIVRPTINEVDVKRLCLWYKTHPHILFPDAQFTIWIDSNIILYPGSEKIFWAHEILSEIASGLHCERDCIYEECDKVTELKLDKEDTVEQVKQELKEAGMPAHHGLYETNVLFSNNQDLGVRDFYKTWWSKIAVGSRRDQLSFTYAAWLHDIQITPLDVGCTVRNSRFFSKRPHIYTVGRKV